MLPQSRPARRHTVAYWPSPDEMATFDKLEAIEARRRAAAEAARAEKVEARVRKPLLAALAAAIVGQATVNAIGGHFG